MKRVKRIFACLLALTMMFGLSATAFADETYTDQSTVTIKKSYKLTNAGTTSPRETFTLEQVGKGEVKDGDATSAPALGTITGATFQEGGAATGDGAIGEITVTLPTYEKVGVYEYTLKEVAGTTAGVTYYGANIKLVVTVINGSDGKLRIAAVHTESEGDKKDTFENTYSAGTLNVSKTVTGNLGDKEKYFEFKVTLTGETGKTYAGSYAVSGGTNTSNPSTIEIGKETTFLLKHGETISIANLPYGVSYTVTETTADGYTTAKNGDTGKIKEADQTAAFTNSKTGEVDTGVYLDNLPYILVFAGVLAIAAVFVVRRRRFED
nr:FctA domain-containing protein [uncultured Anaerobutyricum sp.]